MTVLTKPLKPLTPFLEQDLMSQQFANVGGVGNFMPSTPQNNFFGDQTLNKSMNFGNFMAANPAVQAGTTDTSAFTNILGQGTTQPAIAGTGFMDSMTGKDWMGAGLGVLNTGLGIYGMNRELSLGEDRLALSKQQYADTRADKQARTDAGIRRQAQADATKFMA